MPFDRGADPLIRAGPPGPAFPQIDNSEEADEGVGCGPGVRPTKPSGIAQSACAQVLQATSGGVTVWRYRLDTERDDMYD